MNSSYRERKTILLAEDDEDDVYLFSNAVADLGKDYKIITAADGNECMNILQTRPRPDIVFLDINMPLKSGFECLEEIRSAEHLRNLVVVMLSTATAKNTMEQAYTKGANLYLSKAADYNAFKTALSYALCNLAILD